MLVKEAGGNQLLNLRSALTHYEWKGDWSHKSSKWTPKLREQVGLAYQGGEHDGTFWISY